MINTPDTINIQDVIAELIARLAAADVEREQIMRRCNMQADNLRTYQERVALLECETKVYKPVLEAAENACAYHQQETMDAHYDHALTMDDLRSWAAEYNALARAHDLLTAEHATAHADSLFLQGLRTGFKYTAVFLVLLLITAAACWFGGV